MWVVHDKAFFGYGDREMNLYTFDGLPSVFLPEAASSPPVITRYVFGMKRRVISIQKNR
jgi:hypothetical protein